VSQNSGHLNDEEIRQCANTGPGDSPQLTEAHLSECQDCLERLLRWQGTQLKHLETVGMRQEPYPDCPAEEVVREVAAEMAPPHIARRTLQHAAQCDHCGPLLKSYREAFSEELSPEIAALVDRLPAANPKQQRKMAREMAAQARNNVSKRQGEGVVRRVRPFWVRTLAWTAPLTAVVLFLFLQGPALYAKWKLYHTQQFVAEAYADQRSTEMRLTGVEYGRYNKLIRRLGPEGGSDSEKESPALLNARSSLNEELRSNKGTTPEWQQIEARIALLQGNPEKAEKVLRRALELKSSEGLQIDLAVAYFERGNLSKTIDLLSAVNEDAKATEQEKSTALFNLAIAYQRSEWWDLAADTWKKFLAREKSGPWADEARKGLADATMKLEQHKQKSQLIYDDPGSFLAHASSPAVQQNVEEYVKIAVTAWLPKRDSASQVFFWLQSDSLACSTNNTLIRGWLT
jgi:tetratricopeptide (TPR) repeat protein